MRISDWSSDVCSSDLTSARDRRRTMFQLAGNLQRLGTETAFEVLARAAALEAEGRSIINLGIGQPDFKTPEHVVEAGIKALRDGHHGYTPANGILPLREAVAADLHRRHGVEVDPDQEPEERRVGKECGSTVSSRWSP